MGMKVIGIVVHAERKKEGKKSKERGEIQQEAGDQKEKKKSNRLRL